MPNPITIEVTSAPVLAVLARLSTGLADPRPMLLAWGEDLTESTKQRFVTSTGPDGERWATNTQATFDAYLARFSGTHGKDGKRTGTKKQARAPGGERHGSRNGQEAPDRPGQVAFHADLLSRRGRHALRRQPGGVCRHAAVRPGLSACRYGETGAILPGTIIAQNRDKTRALTRKPESKRPTPKDWPFA